MSAAAQHKDFTVLLADDEWLLCWSLERLLVRKGVRVLIAPTGKAALQLLEGNVVDWVISDLKMPDITGLELLETVREDHPDVHLALMTAYGSEEIEVKAKLLGAAYLAKPFPLESLVTMVLEDHPLETAAY